jgi:hypothetical protein
MAVIGITASWHGQRFACSTVVRAVSPHENRLLTASRNISTRSGILTLQAGEDVNPPRYVQSRETILHVGTEPLLRMTPEPLLTTESKTTLLWVFLGLTAWYVVATPLGRDVLELTAPIGIGVLLPRAVNEARRRTGTD